MAEWELLKALIAEFEFRSRQKHAEVNVPGWAEVRYSPAFVNCNLRRPAEWDFCYPTVIPAYWYIAYCHKDGGLFYNGSKIGHNPKEVIEYILAQREAFP